PGPSPTKGRGEKSNHSPSPHGGRGGWGVREGSKPYSAVINRPFEHQQPQRRQRNPLPRIIRLPACLSRFKTLTAQFDLVARLGVALVGVEQVDRKGASATRPGGLVNAYLVGRLIGELQRGAPPDVVLAPVRIGDFDPVKGAVRP